MKDEFFKLISDERVFFKTLLSELERWDLEYLHKSVSTEVKRRDDLGRVKMLVVTDGFINYKFFNECDYEEAVNFLKELKYKYINDKLLRHKLQIDSKLHIEDSLSIQTVMINADEVESYLKH